MEMLNQKDCSELCSCSTAKRWQLFNHSAFSQTSELNGNNITRKSQHYNCCGRRSAAILLKFMRQIGAAACSQDMCVWVCVCACTCLLLALTTSKVCLGVQNCLGLGIRLLRKVRVRDWGMYYMYESPHKDRSTVYTYMHVCVCEWVSERERESIAECGWRSVLSVLHNCTMTQIFKRKTTLRSFYFSKRN